MKDKLRELLCVLADEEVHIESDEVILVVQKLLFSEDKRIAQAAASVLCMCCGVAGKDAVMEVIALSSVPHKDLIIGIVKLLGGR